MFDRRLVALSRVTFCLALLCLAIFCAATFALPDAQSATPLGDVLFAAGTLVFAIAGFVIIRRQPRDAVGWVLLGVGFSWQFSGVVDLYATWGFAHPASSPGHRLGAAALK